MEVNILEYLEFAYFSLTDKQKKTIEYKFKVSKQLGNKHKEIAKQLPICRERVTEIINYELPEIDRQLNNWYQDGTVMFNNARGEIVYEYLPE